MDLGPKSPVKPPMDCNKIDRENAMPGSLHQHPEAMKQSSKQLTFLFKHRKVKGNDSDTTNTTNTVGNLTNSLTNGCNIPLFHNESMNQLKSTCNYL